MFVILPNVFISLKVSLVRGREDLVCESLDSQSKIVIHFAKGLFVSQKASLK